MITSGIGVNRASSVMASLAPMQSTSPASSSRAMMRSRPVEDAETMPTRNSSGAIRSTARPRTLAQRNGGVDPLSAAHQTHSNPLADAITAKRAVQVTHVVQRPTAKLDQNIADEHACLLGGSLRRER